MKLSEKNTKLDKSIISIMLKVSSKKYKNECTKILIVIISRIWIFFLILLSGILLFYKFSYFCKCVCYLQSEYLLYILSFK